MRKAPKKGADMWNELLGAAHAWLLFLDQLDGRALRNTCLPWLSSDEREHYNTFSTDPLRLEYLAGTALCRRSLSNYVPVDPSRWRFARNSSGKPKIVAPLECTSLKFSLARTKGLAVCLVTRAGAAGVDVENTSRSVDVAAIARHFLPQAEVERLAALPQAERSAALFKLWVLHEAYVKGTGKGLGGVAEEVRVRLGPGDVPLPIANWKLFLYKPSATHVAGAAIAQPRAGPPVSVSWLTSSLFETRISVED